MPDNQQTSDKDNLATLTGKQMPSSFAGRHHDCVRRLLTQETERSFQVQNNRRRFFLAILSLLGWYLGGPFAQTPPLHFVIQTFGVFLVAFGIGVLRVLQTLVPLRGLLSSIRLDLINFEDTYGIDFKAGTGDPTEKARRLTPKVIQELNEHYGKISIRLSEVEGQVETSLFGVYSELFDAIRTSRGRVVSEPTSNGAKKKNAPV